MLAHLKVGSSGGWPFGWLDHLTVGSFDGCPFKWWTVGWLTHLMVGPSDSFAHLMVGSPDGWPIWWLAHLMVCPSDGWPILRLAHMMVWPSDGWPISWLAHLMVGPFHGWTICHQQIWILLIVYLCIVIDWLCEQLLTSPTHLFPWHVRYHVSKVSLHFTITLSIILRIQAPTGTFRSGHPTAEIKTRLFGINS